MDLDGEGDSEKTLTNNDAYYRGPGRRVIMDQMLLREWIMESIGPDPVDEGVAGLRG
jgi:hypothetical protein